MWYNSVHGTRSTRRKILLHDGRHVSFGLMMWEMWFGERVFSELRSQGLSRGELFRRIKEQNYRPRTSRSRERFFPNPPPPAQWTELTTPCWQTDPRLKKTEEDCSGLQRLR